MAVSDQFLDAIVASHRIAVRATLLDAGEETELVTVIDGSVTLDARAISRGRMDVSIVDDGTLGLVPTEATAPLAPYGNEIRLERGVTYRDGTTELAALGVFRIDDADVDDDGQQLVIHLTGLDRSARIADAKFEAPYQVAAGTNYTEAILDAIQAAYPDVVHDLADTTLTTPQLLAEEGADRWAFCQEMATSIGMDLYFDGIGTLVLRPVAQFGASEPIWDIVEGENGVLITAARRWSRQGAFNRVIATGENTGEAAPSRGVATDDNPLSPTYYYGPFGKVPRFHKSQLITSDDQAVDAAAAILAREIGTTQSVELGSVVNPALIPGDVIRATRARAGIDEDHIVDQLTVPLAATAAMTVRTRAMQVI